VIKVKNLTLLILKFSFIFIFTLSSYAQEYDTPQSLEQAFERAKNLEKVGSHLKASEIYFNIYTFGESKFEKLALERTAYNLVMAGFPNAASYFYIRTLLTKDKSIIRKALQYLPKMIDNVGFEFLKNYILENTQESDYEGLVKNHFYYYLGKSRLLEGNYSAALEALNKVGQGSGLLAQSYSLKGAAFAILNKNQQAIQAYEACNRIVDKEDGRTKKQNQALEDLKARCLAGLARVYYQIGDHKKAEEVFDEIQKSTFVWTDILFEQAWNSFVLGDVNRALGRLVTYKSPSLSFVFNPEVEVLKAQAYLSYCLYDEVNKVVVDFNREYTDIGVKIKDFLLKNSNNLNAFFNIAKEAYYSKLHTQNQFYKALNRFVRGAYFPSFITQDKKIKLELKNLGGEKNTKENFYGFLVKILNWRLSMNEQIAGSFIRSALTDLYNDLLTQFDQISFIKLEMLKQAKESLESKQELSQDEDGVYKKGGLKVNRKDYQYLWNFNGEFWIDELGDYVFALESNCK
jgi:hypothetical protein